MADSSSWTDYGPGMLSLMEQKGGGGLQWMWRRTGVGSSRGLAGVRRWGGPSTWPAREKDHGGRSPLLLGSWLRHPGAGIDFRPVSCLNLCLQTTQPSQMLPWDGPKGRLGWVGVFWLVWGQVRMEAFYLGLTP